MPARIIVESGARPGEYPIERDVLLLGSDGTVASLPAELTGAGHAATLEYRQGRYTVYNRLPQPMRLGAQPLAVRGSREWRPGERLYPSDAAVLRLEVEGDPAPARAAPKAVVVPDVPDGPAEEKAAKKGGSKWWQYALIAGCLVLLIGSFLANRDEPPAEGAPGVDIDKLVEDLRKQEGDGGPSVAALLKEARASELRGLRGEANRMYQRVAIILRQRHGEGLTTASEAEKKADAFARSRLSAGSE
jgi:hypothetical protein